jgi:23S rRNA (uracil1939-C5)-methyltransferase
LIREGEEILLEVRDLAFGGRGVARTPDGLVVFVEGALPGESIRARITRSRSGFAEAVPRAILRASPDRVAPRCEHYAECGGCDLQHLRTDAQAGAKRGQVIAMLSRIAGIDDPPVRETIRPVEPWSYRFRADFDWTLGAGERATLGLHRRGSATIVPIRRCHLISDRATRILGFLSKVAGERRLTPWDPRRRSGLLRRTTIQEARGTGEILLSLETGRGESGALADLAEALTRAFPRIVGIVRRERDKQGRPVQESILAGRDHLYEEIDSDRFKIPAGSFFQPNARTSIALRAEAVAALDPGPGDEVLELFCGVGFMTASLARSGARVTAVEGMGEAAAAARENLSALEADVRIVCAEVSRALPGLLAEREWQGILLDPPRTGLPRGAAAELASSAARRIAYVSCDPATLARDARILVASGRFRLTDVIPFDLFPQTRHIECIALLLRA